MESKKIEQKDPEETLKSIIEEQFDALSNCLKAINNNELEVKSITITDEHLDKKFNASKKFSKPEYFKDLYAGLEKKNPVLYWFTIDTEKFNKESFLKFYEKRVERLVKKTDNKRMAYIPEKPRDFSKTLYVGKVIDKFQYRFVNHLGHNVDKNTASLQLTCWYNAKLFGNLKFNYIVLDPKMKSLIGVLEIELAKKLMPLIGSHKN
jgi:hypothetical protein